MTGEQEDGKIVRLKVYLDREGARRELESAPTDRAPETAQGESG